MISHLLTATSFAQVKDSIFVFQNKTITLSEVVVNNKLNIPTFINRIKDDTTFYKAFKNLRVLSFSAINDIRMNNSDGGIKAYLHSKTKQIRTETGCRKMETLEEQASGDIYDVNRNFNYYTAEMYGSLFFTKDSVCGETNVVKGIEFNSSNKSGMEKHKEQLKILFFNPGRKIKGIPFLSGKTEIFGDDLADKYDMKIDMAVHNNVNCYVFKQKVRPGHESNVVIDEMTTWFDAKTFEVLARNYTLSYSAAVYDFKVDMQVEMTRFGDLVVPSVIRYNGNWKALFKKRERGVFTATLFDFKK